eukprot:526047-Pleurochrysis_carterae.AAC.1
MAVAQKGARARLAPAARGEAMRPEPPQTPAAPRTLRDLPPGLVTKLSALNKSDTSAAALRAADAIVLQLLKTMAAMTAEATAAPEAGDAAA